jgi:hypothetical protein
MVTERNQTVGADLDAKHWNGPPGGALYGDTWTVRGTGPDGP